MSSTSRLCPNMDAQHSEKPHSHASTNRTSSARSQSSRSAQRRAGAPRRAGQQGAGPQGLGPGQRGPAAACRQLPGVQELGVDSHLAALRVLERRLGGSRAGRWGAGRGARVQHGLCRHTAWWLLMLVETSGVRSSGWMDRQWACCPSAARNLNLVERVQQPVS